MTPEEVKRLVALGESLELELKGERLRALSDAELVEAVIFMSNRSSQA